MSVIFQIALYVIVAAVFVILFLAFYKRNDKKEIVRFLKRLALFAIPLFIIISLLVIDSRRMAPTLNGISMKDQIDSSFSYVTQKPYHTIIMGNSRTYRGVNPEFMDSTTFNFSFDNETFLEQYFKLKYLEANNALPKLIVLGVDYFEFSFLSLAMQESYSKYFGTEYDSLMLSLSNANGAEYGKIETVDDWVNSKMSGAFGRGASQYLHYFARKIAGNPVQAPYLKSNGQYIINPVPQAYDGEFMTRSSKMQPYQKEKFEQIITFCCDKNIRLVLLMPPCREIELGCYTDESKNQMNSYFKSFEEPERVWYLNLSNLKQYDTKDYMDETHLKPDAADRFSKTLNDTLISLK